MLSLITGPPNENWLNLCGLVTYDSVWGYWNPPEIGCTRKFPTH